MDSIIFACILISHELVDQLEPNLHLITLGHDEDIIIQLMHSFEHVEVNIWTCQPENSEIHRGEAELNITFEG